MKRAKGKKNKKTGFLSTQCTIQGQSGSPQESHLISSSLHVINLPAQCYCSAGHSSSFRGRGIDQAGTASVLHLCVSWANGKKNEQNCPEHTTHPVFVPLYMHARVRVLDLQTSMCFGLFAYWRGLIQLAIFCTYRQYILTYTFLLSVSRQENRHRGRALHC